MSSVSALLSAHPAGDRAVLLDLAGADAVRGVHTALTEAALPGIVDLVPGASTLLVIGARSEPAALRTAVELARSTPVGHSTHTGPDDGPTVHIPVRYDGEDLAAIAARCELSPAEVVTKHSSVTYTAAFLGLTPGFTYLTGIDPALELPRRSTPRTSVPAGTVAIASEYTGVYPRSSPGGWHLLGSTTVAMWDLNRRPQALLVPGTRVRFEPVG